MRFVTSIALLTSISLPVSVWAADPGTYRPGQAYMATPVTSSGQCEAQCHGDAQCKGWNFIQPQVRSNGGICELNARVASPVVSPHSTSGVGVMARQSPNLIQAGARTYTVGKPQLLQGRTNTVRVGSAAPIPATITKTRTRRAPVSVAPTPSAPITSRPQSFPQHQQARTTAHTQQMANHHAQPRSANPQYRHILDAGVTQMQRTAPIQRTAQEAQSPTPQYGQAHADPRVSRLQQMVARQSPPASKVSTPPQHIIPTRGQVPMPPGYTPPQASFQAPQQVAQHAQPHPQSISVPSPAEMISPKVPVGISVAAAEESLFGSLYDDVTAPKSLTAQDIPTDSDAPIATVSRVPTKKVTVEDMMAGPPQ